MSVKKKAVTAVIAAAVICAAGAGGWFAWKKLSKNSELSKTKVYVQKVEDLNTAGGFDVSMSRFSCVVEAQASTDVKYDTSKTIDQILVKEGDTVQKGDQLLTYDIESIDLQLEQAKLEAEKLQAQIDSNNAQIKQLEAEKKNANSDAVISYNTQILSLQSENASNEFDKKTKDAEAAKLEKSKENAYVTAPSDGTVTDLKSSEELIEQGADVIMKITAEGAYRVKGKVNEQNLRDLYEGCPVILHSRVDDTAMKGTVSKIENKPAAQQDDMYSMDNGEDDGMSNSSSYTFYVDPEDPEALTLGQHLLAELDYGQEERIDKDGIWLYSDFVITKDGKSYVWAKDSDGLIEKREVTLGKKDDENGDVEIKSGLKESDYIAYPSSYIKEGMTATKNESEVSVAPNDLAYGEGDDDFLYEGEDNDIYEDGEEIEYDDPFADIDPEVLEQMTDEELEAYLDEYYGTVDTEDDSYAEDAGSLTDDAADAAEG